MAFLRRSCRKVRLDRIRNETLKTNKSVRIPQLRWFGDIKRMVEHRRTRRILEWMPRKRTRIGRPRRRLRDEIDKAMELRNS